jgi:thiol-disulfide isomerase/thioredoxin
MNRSTIVTLCTVLALLCMAGAVTYYFYSTPNDASNSDAKRTLALGEETFTDLHGESVSFESYEGKIRVVNVWASWSPFSAQELPLLEAAAKKYSEKDVVFIAINRNESKELATRYLETLGTFESITIVIDPVDGFFATVGGFAMPETIIFDTNGNIATHKRGNLTEQELYQLIDAAIAATE